MENLLGLITPFNSAFRGWVVSILWGWFVAPTFGLPPLRIPVALGIALLVSLLTFHDSENEKETAYLQHVLKSFLISTIALVFGAIYHAFI